MTPTHDGVPAGAINKEKGKMVTPTVKIRRQGEKRVGVTFLWDGEGRQGGSNGGSGRRRGSGVRKIGSEPPRRVQKRPFGPD